MNGDAEQAVGFLGGPDSAAADAAAADPAPRREAVEDHSRWRLAMAQRIAEQLVPERYGVRALYVVGSTKNANAGPDSDIDLLVHVADGASPERRELELWLDGWSRALAEFNFLRTGVRREGLLDVAFVDDDDVARGRGLASRIDAVTDPARALPLGPRAAV